METASIKGMKERVTEIRRKIKGANYSKYESVKFGSEDEYTFKDLLIGLDNLTLDISTLTKFPKKFIAVSSSTQRRVILNNLARIDEQFSDPYSFFPSFEELKLLMISFNVRGIPERQIEYEKELDGISQIKINIQADATQVKLIKSEMVDVYEVMRERLKEANENFANINEQLKSINEEKQQLMKQIEDLQYYNDELETAKEKADENLVEISNSLTESKSNEKLIAAFANNVQERDNKLSEITVLTEENTKKLAAYDSERIKILDEAKKLIDSAKEALNYKSAEGISASFQEQYEKANNKWVFRAWIAGAILCLLSTIGLGIYILHSIPDEIGILIARISLLPIPIIGAIFCANQYTKQKNIIEDYAYKMVLAKSIVGFSEQLKRNSSGTNEEYIHYIKTALEEIHRDPLRKRNTATKIETKSEPLNLDKLGDLLEKIAKIAKPE